MRNFNLVVIGLILIMAVGIVFYVCNPTDAEYQQIVASDGAIEPRVIEEPEQVVNEVKYTEDELFCMAAAIYNEAGGDMYSDETRRLVGYVILNRVNDSRYPNTIREVLQQKSQYGRFYWTGIKFADRHTSPNEQHAVERAYAIAKEVLSYDAIPIPASVVFQAEFIQGTSIYSYQDGLYFCEG